jgi:hypothetical protein
MNVDSFQIEETLCYFPTRPMMYNTLKAGYFHRGPCLNTLCVVVCLMVLGIRMTHGDVKSRTGTINFDRNNDGISEMRLNSTGLGVGVSPQSKLHVGGNAIITDSMSVGSSTVGSSSLQVEGTFGMSFQTVSSNVTVGSHSIILADSSAENLTVTLPDVNQVGSGRVYIVKKTSPLNEVSISGDANIDGLSGVMLTSGSMGHLNIISGSGNWYIRSISGDGVYEELWTPGDVLSSIDVWYDASDTSTVLAGASDNVYQWNDKSGNSNDAAQGVSTNQPTQNSDSIIFASNDYLEVAHGVMPDTTEASMVFIVGLATSTIEGFLSNGRFSQGGSSYSYRTSNAGQSVTWYSWGNDFADVPISTPYSNLSIHGIELSMTGSSVKIYQNATLEGTKSSYTGAANGGTELGLIGKTYNTEFLNGEISEIIVLKQEPDVDMRQKIEGFLAHKWGIQANLPAGHPFENAAPTK